MPKTTPISSRVNAKSTTSRDFPLIPAQLVTQFYSATSSASQVIINLSFSIPTTNTNNFLLIVDGKVLTIGSANDYTFTNIQSNGTSAQITLTQALTSGMNIQAIYLGVAQPPVSATSLSTTNATLASVSTYVGTKFRNQVINGNFDYWQRVETTTTTINTAATTVGYTADMFTYSSTGATTKNYSVVQSSDVPTVAQSGFASQLSYLFTMITGIASPAASDLVEPCRYQMEGYDFQRIHQKSVTLSFWVKASQAGTYSVALRNAAATRSYVTTFSVAAANTWQFTSIAITLDQAGTWTFSNSVALYIDIAAVAGTTYQTSTLGSWQTGDFLAASTATNWQSTSGATLKVAQVGLTEGSGFGATDFIRCGATVQEELSLCQRYYEKSYAQGTVPATATLTTGIQVAYITTSIGSQVRYQTVNFKVTKRIATATVTIYPYTTPTNTFRVSDGATGTDLAAGSGNIWVQNDQSFTLINGTGGTIASSNGNIMYHWTVDGGL